MKIHVVCCNNESTTVPPILRAMRSKVIDDLAGYFRVLGLAKLKLTLHQTGLEVRTAVSFLPFPIEAPPEIVAAREYLLRRLADIMQFFEIFELEFTADEAELRELQQIWKEMAVIGEQQIEGKTTDGGEDAGTGTQDGCGGAAATPGGDTGSDSA